jgi:hypothetical protein
MIHDTNSARSIDEVISIVQLSGLIDGVELVTLQRTLWSNRCKIYIETVTRAYTSIIQID